MIAKEELVDLIRDVIKSIKKDFLAYDDDEQPGIFLTISHNPKTDHWSYNMDVSGYGWREHVSPDSHPNWASISVYEEDDPEERADAVLYDLENLAAESDTVYAANSIGSYLKIVK